MFRKILIANRGEIALRVLRACKELGVRTVAVHSTADHDAMHVRLADESVCIGPARSRDSYLNMQAILSAATITRADAIHPGVGFLSENETFARMVQDHGITFIGPDPEHIACMGDKVRAKQTAVSLGMPVIPGSEGAIAHSASGLELARTMGFPVLIKAASGGGGRGMKVVHDAGAWEESWSLARSEAEAHFGNPAVYMEKYLTGPRHIEVQVLADAHGRVIHLGERDCSLQRRHQKVWEETPSPGLTPEEREQVGRMAAQATRDMGYKGVGTFEFLYEKGAFWFMEMNTRIQVEHPVTEMVTGIDLIQEQIRSAAGVPLGLSQDDVRFQGHAIECRINAEHPETFAPSPGKIGTYHVPGGFGVRVDSAVYTGYTIPPHYDSLIAKLVTHAPDRASCIHRMQRAVREYVIAGVNTLLPLHDALTSHPRVVSGDYTIHTLEQILAEKASSPAP